MPHLVESAIKRAILEVLSTDDVRTALEALAHDAVYAYIARKQ